MDLNYFFVSIIVKVRVDEEWEVKKKNIAKACFA